MLRRAAKHLVSQHGVLPDGSLVLFILPLFSHLPQWLEPWVQKWVPDKVNHLRQTQC